MFHAEYITCLIPSLVIIVYVFRTSNRCTLQANQISVQLHGIKKFAMNYRLSTLVRTTRKPFHIVRLVNCDCHPFRSNHFRSRFYTNRLVSMQKAAFLSTTIHYVTSVKYDLSANMTWQNSVSFSFRLFADDWRHHNVHGIFRAVHTETQDRISARVNKTHR